MKVETRYDFRGVRRDGTMEVGAVRAVSREAAVRALAGRGIFVTAVTTEARTLPARIRIGAEDLALGLRALATLVGSGLSISRALASLEDLVPASWSPALPALRRAVTEGDRLSAAFEASAVPLPPHVLGIIAAGEAGSALGEALENAAGVLESRAATRAALRSALAYPATLAIAGSISVVLLVGLVLPRFVSLLDETGQTLPLTTRLVVGLGELARPGLIPLLVLVTLCAGVWRAWIRTPAGLRRWHGLLHGLPGVGSIRRGSGTAGGAIALAALLRAGVPLAAALPHAARATGDRVLEESLGAARDRVLQGQPFSAALAAESALTPTAVRFARIGEQTGEMARMMAAAGDIESRQAMQRLQRLIRLVEPAMILIFGLIVMLVAAALLQAMYGMRPSP